MKKILFTLFALMFATPALAVDVPCAIRWDAWYNNSASAYALRDRNNLSQPAWRHRLPIHADDSALATYVLSPSPIEAEITAAANAGLCWAFLHYSTAGLVNAVGLNDGWDLYAASTHKANVKSFWINYPDYLIDGNATAITEIVGHMQQSYWLKVGTNRPVYAVLWTTSGSPSMVTMATRITALRSAATTAGLGDPYVIAMPLGTMSYSALATGIGADAVSDYQVHNIYPIRGTYAALAANAEGLWTSALLASGFDVAPIMMTGWDNRPRYEIPVVADRPGWIERDVYFAPPTTTELAAHAQEAIDFMDANPTETPYRLIMMYSWNECSEGTCVMPTKGQPDYIAALKSKFNP